ncbi:hypothetical protein NL676_012929 [Syzygium grande]|nr:hypothetical protein NL676_012929 [Syzygium grande]
MLRMRRAVDFAEGPRSPLQCLRVEPCSSQLRGKLRLRRQGCVGRGIFGVLQRRGRKHWHTRGSRAWTSPPLPLLPPPPPQSPRIVWEAAISGLQSGPSMASIGKGEERTGGTDRDWHGPSINPYTMAPPGLVMSPVRLPSDSIGNSMVLPSVRLRKPWMEDSEIAEEIAEEARE